jgi:hypothetical protein
MKRKNRKVKWTRATRLAAVLSAGMAYQTGGCQVDIPDLNTQVGIQVEQDPRFYDAQDRFYDTFDRLLDGFGGKF